MNLSLKSAPLAAAVAVFAMGTGSASAALVSGTDASANSSVFISLAERSNTNAIIRNLVIDIGARALDVFAGTPWSTTAAQEAEVLAFVSSSAATSRVVFNVGGSLNDQTGDTDRFGFLSTGNAAGPAVDGFAQLSTGVANTIQKIGNSNNGTFNANGILLSTGPALPGFHGNQWGNNYGGALQPSNEVLLGAFNQIVGWRLDPNTFEIVRSVLGPVSSNLQSGDITFGVVPVPAAVWLFGSALGLIGVMRRRAAA